MSELELIGTFDAFYKRYASNQNTQGGLELVLGVPREHVAEAIKLSDTEGEMFVLTIQKKIRRRMEELPAPPPDDHFRVWVGDVDDE
jgi:hypothetical protein